MASLDILQILKEANKSGNYCCNCGKPLKKIDLVFKIVKGCPDCENLLSDLNTRSKSEDITQTV